MSAAEPTTDEWETVETGDLRDGDLVRETVTGTWCTHIANAAGFTRDRQRVLERRR